MGLLGAAQFAPYLLVTLFAGVAVDRLPKRQVMIISNLARGLMLSLIPILLAVNALQIEYLYLIGFAIGVFSVFFDLGYQAYLPSLVAPEELVDANSKLIASSSAAEIGGPGLAGILVERITAPMAILADAFSYVVSAVGLSLIQEPEQLEKVDIKSETIIMQIKAGLRVVFGDKRLRALMGEATIYNFFWMTIFSAFVLYATKDLRISAGFLGLIISAGNIGALVGSLAAKGIAKRLGVGRTLVVGVVTARLGPILIPLASGTMTALILVLSYILTSFGGALSNVHFISLRQRITPQALLWRMNASYRFFVTRALPLGSLLGGALGKGIGLKPTLFVGAFGLWLAVLPILFSPLPRLREKPNAR